VAISLERGIFTAVLGIAGGGAVMIAPTQLWIGYTMIALAVVIAIWGVRINGRPWWRRRPDIPEPGRKDAHIQIGQIGEADLRNNETGSRPLLQSDKIGKLRASGNRLGQSQGRDHDEEKK
jgi:hypothetical protein